jgi:hypothetical protein
MLNATLWNDGQNNHWTGTRGTAYDLFVIKASGEHDFLLAISIL